MICSDKVSVTVLAQALAFILRSNFFLTFLRGVFLASNLSVTPGNSPCFQCFFLTGDEEEGGGDFLAGVILGADVSVIPGNSPCFQCLFLSGEEEEEEEGGGGDFLAGAANVQRTTRELESKEDEIRMGKKEEEP